MTYAVIGSAGFVGKILWDQLKRAHRADTIVGASFGVDVPGQVPLDIRDEGAVRSFFVEHRPQVVYLPAAIPNVEWVETHADEAALTNVEGVRHVVEACRQHDAKLIFFSSDYVFDGEDGPYDEAAPTNPLNAYGQQKLAAEQLVLTLPTALVARITGVYDWDPGGKNFIMQLVERVGTNHEPMRVPSDQWATPIMAGNLAELLDDVVTNRDARGVLHVAPDDFLARDDFARRACTVFGFDATLIQPTPTSELGQVARRPHKAGFRNERLKSLTQVSITGVREGLARVAEQYQRSLVA